MTSVAIAVAVTTAIQAAASMAVFTPPVLAPVGAPDMGLPPVAVGLCTALIYGTAALSAPLSASVIARHGPLRTSQVALLLTALGCVTLAIGQPVFAVLGAMLVGMGYGPITPSSSAILGARTPVHLRAFIFSLKQTGVPAGGVAAGLLLPPVLHAAGWRAAAVAMAAICVAIVVATQPFRAAADAARDRTRRLRSVAIRAPLALVWHDADLRRMGLASAAYSGMQMTLGSYLVVLLHDTAGFGVAQAGVVLSVAMAGGVAGRVGWGLVVDRGVPGARVLGGLGLAMAAFACAMPWVGPDWPHAAVLALAFGFGATAVGWNGVHLAEVSRISRPEDAAAATGGSLFLTFSGVLVAPVVVWAVERAGGGYAAGFVVVAAFTAWRGARFFGTPRHADATG
ncbi:MAG: MFS transporter [Burkholderiales bacterium]|nr:MFS transporter [Burkholderiales bacterium]